MIKVILYGAAGRMGREIINAVEETSNIRIIAGIETKGHPAVGMNIANVKITDRLAGFLPRADCIVDFTNRKATMTLLQKLKIWKKPLVIGTTGITRDDLGKIRSYAKNAPVLLSPNMSIGVAQLYRLARDTANVLRDYDIEIVETHHRGKKDAPSGTAMKIAAIIKEIRPGTRFIYGRQGISDGKKSNEVCINSVRGGDIAGEHRVLFMSNGEFIELRHYATSRRCFAQGTLRAIKWLVNKKPGIYQISDTLAIHA